MVAGAPSRITLAELDRLLKAVERAAVLLPPRLLRRVIKHDREVSGLGLQVPHRRSYVISSPNLLKIVEPEELGLPVGDALPPRLVLLARPGSQTLETTPRADLLVRYWRTLFHARVHVQVEERLAARGAAEAEVRKRVGQIGEVEFAEIRSVLHQDEYLLPPADDREVYVEFAAVYLELRCFAPARLAHYFPAVGDFERIDRLLAEDIDVERLLAATRLDGACDPVVAQERDEDAPEQPDRADEQTGECSPSDARACAKLLVRADAAASSGNLVRAAVLRMRAAAAEGEEARAAARGDVARLADRLRAALGLAEKDADQWRSALLPLLGPASRGLWPVEARLLYDLQKACIDREQEVYAVDLVEWAVSLGRRPVKRPVPCQRDVLLLKHLRSAGQRLKAARVSEPYRRRLAGLLQAAVRSAERHVRDRFRPLIRGVLEEVGMAPQNLPEQAALHQLTEELLDRACARGFLTMGDLRDAISRNNLKLPDLAGVREFWHGDRLLRANRGLAVALDGVYRRGEIYLRGLQRVSAVAFGTRPGRFLTRYAVLPFGGAFVILEGLQHIINPISRALTGNRVHLMTPISVAVVGLFLLGLLHSARFRGQVVRALHLTYLAVRGLLIDVPAYGLHALGVRRLLESPPLVWFRRYTLKPLLAGTLAAAGTWLAGAEGWVPALVGATVSMAAAALVNTRFGRDLEEAVVDRFARFWQRVQFDLLPGLFRLIMGAFKRLIEAVDRCLYSVDEWLRFRTGDSRLSLAAKAALGLVWFFVAYVVRFCINLLIEPQVNPIKHFPVVTVSHKLVLGLFVPPFAHLLSLTMDKALAGTVAVTTGTAIPGIFGFLVWELKENWRLYRANQPAALQPVIVGSHGETILRLLRPGFHSGTLPKLFAKLRRAERDAQRNGNWATARKHEAALHHVEEAVRAFVDRELVYPVNAAACRGEWKVSTGLIHLASNRVGIELLGTTSAPRAPELAFEEYRGTLRARIADGGWLALLPLQRRQLFLTAVRGLYKMAGAEQVGRPGEPGFDAEFKDRPLAWQEWLNSWAGAADDPGAAQPAGTHPPPEAEVLA
jgi:hypothetical protein